MQGFCVERRDGGIRSLDKCRSPLWIHRFEVPGNCRRTFTYSLEPKVMLSFPVSTGSSNYRFCIIIDKEKGFIETYSSKGLESLLKDIGKLFSSHPVKGIGDVLYTLFKGLISYYHQELSKIDTEIEDIIDRILKEGEITTPIYRVYGRASRLHRGVHGVIFALHRIERVINDIKELLDEAIMLENMYSTSIDRITEALTIYFTLISDQTNKIVTKLTIISAIFLPLTLIAGIYGMNFKYMPELSHPLAYPIVLSVMILIAVSELMYFKKRGWI